MAGPGRVGRGPLTTGILIVATITTGLTAGVFVHWSNTVMPGLRTVDDRAFVEAFLALDAAITNPLFIGVQLTGALLFIALSVVLHLRAEWRPVLFWVSVALVGYLVALAVTFAVNVPLTEQLRATGADSGADLAAARAELDEAMWTMWNTVRAVASTIAFVCLAWALVLRGRLGTGGGG